MSDFDRLQRENFALKKRVKELEAALAPSGAKNVPATKPIVPRFSEDGA